MNQPKQDNKPIEKHSRESVTEAKKPLMPPEVCEEEELAPEVFEILEELPEEKRNILLEHYCYIKQSSFSGPIPPPETLRGYEGILNGSMDRILKMAEKEQDHRIDMESKIVHSEVSLSKTGQICGLSLVVFFGIIALVLGLFNHDVLAGMVFCTTIIGVAVIFVLRKLPKSETKPKKEDSEE